MNREDIDLICKKIRRKRRKRQIGSERNKEKRINKKKDIRVIEKKPRERQFVLLA